MTREEFRDKKSKDYRKYRESYGIKNPVYLDEIEDAYYQGMVDADAHPHWISVEDELPKNRESILFTDGGCVYSGRYYGGRYYGDKGDWVDFCEVSTLIEDVTHWMPLPEPPKKGGKQ